MKLYLNETSPFSRVVIATALLCEHQELILEWVDPWASPTELEYVNPFCTIPTLVLSDSVPLTESVSICQHLIETGSQQSLRNIDYRCQHESSIMGFAKTLMESAFRTTAIGRFIGEDNELHRRGKIGLERALSRLEQALATNLNSRYLNENIGVLYLHVAIDYINLRHRDVLCHSTNKGIDEFIKNSPFSVVLEQVSLDRLAGKPYFHELLL